MESTSSLVEKEEPSGEIFMDFQDEYLVNPFNGIANSRGNSGF
jgi:hypothetical protein